ncbi:unnamed protein product [Phytophthora lilii]|uniref:Unnamed protein product n=1 Tax=Phytophthora lilii TaxID=2077276 RepID=A0A9W6YII9_9STRA|nr:unnamed protein product [Phytophthora lilii]
MQERNRLLLFRSAMSGKSLKVATRNSGNSLCSEDLAPPKQTHDVYAVGAFTIRKNISRILSRNSQSQKSQLKTLAPSASLSPRVPAMSMLQQAARKRPAEAAPEAPKRLRAEAPRPTLSEMLSRKAAAEPKAELSLSQQSNESDVPLARVAARHKAKRAELKAKTQPQMQAKSRGTTNEQGDVVFELSSKRRVTARQWKGMKFVDIREFYDDNGQAKPGKKGADRWKLCWEKLYGFSDAIAEAIQLVEEDEVAMDSLAGVPGCILRPDGDVRAIALPVSSTALTLEIGKKLMGLFVCSMQLSNKRRVTVRYFRKGVLIDLREFYDQDGVSKPGKKGISLSKEQWTALQEVAEDITEAADRL